MILLTAEWSIELQYFRFDSLNIQLKSCIYKDSIFESNIELSHLIAWISQLEPLAVRLGEIQAPDAQIKEKIEEKERKIVSETQKLNIKTTTTAEYKRYKCNKNCKNARKI